MLNGSYDWSSVSRVKSKIYQWKKICQCCKKRKFHLLSRYFQLDLDFSLVYQTFNLISAEQRRARKKRGEKAAKSAKNEFFFAMISNFFLLKMICAIERDFFRSFAGAISFDELFFHHREFPGDVDLDLYMFGMRRNQIPSMYRVR